jgi:YD repeat-containing protein
MSLFGLRRLGAAAALAFVAMSVHAQVIPGSEGLWYYPSSISGFSEECRIPEVYSSDPNDVALQVMRNNNAVTTMECGQTCRSPYTHLRTEIISETLAKAYLRSNCTGSEYSYDIIKKPNPKASSCPSSGTAGNPCNLATGYKVQKVTDYSDAEGDLALSRLYTSGPYNGADMPLGPKWQLSYARRGLGFSRPVEAYRIWEMRAFFWRPQGNMVSFSYDQASGTWKGDPDVSERLTQRVGVNGLHDGWILQTDGAATREVYDAAGRLIRLEDERGPYVWLSYDANGLLKTAADRKGRAIQFTFESGRLKKASLPDGGELTYNYISGMLGWVTYPDATPGVSTDNPWVKYLYEKSGQPMLLTGIIDENGNRSSTWDYDSLGRVSLSVHGDSTSTIDRVSVSYGSDGSATVTSPLGAVTTTSFEARHGVRRLSGQSALCPGCNGIQFKQRTFDANGHDDVVTDFRGSQTDFDFDTNGLLAQQVDAKNDTAGAKRTIQTDWDAALRIPLQRRHYDAGSTLLRTDAWSYNARGQVIVQSQSDGTSARSSAISYCEQADVDAGTCPLVGQALSVDGPRTDVSDATRYSYYLGDDSSCVATPAVCPHRKGDLWKVVDALGRATEILRYDGAGRALSVKDPNGVVTDYEYHPRGWVTAIKVRGGNDSSEADDRITRFEYWPVGTVRKVTLPDGSFTSYAYDLAKRLSDVVDMDGNSIHYTLDNAGNRTREDTKAVDGTLKRVLSRVYNALGQLQAQKDASQNATTFRYDENGNQDRTTDALGRITDQSYDPLNRLARALQNVGGLNVETKFEYDALDRLTTVLATRLVWPARIPASPTTPTTPQDRSRPSKTRTIPNRTATPTMH